MTNTTGERTAIIGGVDTRQDLHTAAVVDLDGAVLGCESFSTTRAGYRAMLRWLRSHGELLRIGVESTGSYGAGISRHLALSGTPVLEVTGPDRAGRRAKGKDDSLDAIAAAEAARTGRRVQVAKDRAGAVEALRVLRTTRKTRLSGITCLRAIALESGKEDVRDQIRNLTRMQRLRTCARWRADGRRRRESPPATSEASFAMMCGACPIPASSGKTQRHRLNRGGNRQANSALHMVVVCRMRTDPRTRAYVTRRTREGLSKREVMRCLKRYVDREIYRVLTAPPAT